MPHYEEHVEFDDAPYDLEAIKREAEHRAFKAKNIAELRAYYSAALRSGELTIEGLKAELAEVQAKNTDVEEGRASVSEYNSELASVLSQIIEESERQAEANKA